MPRAIVLCCATMLTLANFLTALLLPRTEPEFFFRSIDEDFQLFAPTCKALICYA